MTPVFGKRPSGARLECIKKSPNYRDGKFRNLHDTPQLTQGLGTALYDYAFKKSKEGEPKEDLPSLFVDWEKIDSTKPTLVWLGHSSYLIFIDGKKILVDPVLSQSASPIPGGGKPFKGTTVTSAEALPAVDYLIITHDHYDHMDYETLKKIKDKVGHVITGLGVGEHLEFWGYKPEQITETDWWDETDLGSGFKLTTAPARHFSGRNIWAANTLWTSYVLQTPTKKIYIGGDSGYDDHFVEIGNKFGPFDLAILENGQYDKSWGFIHMQPEQVLQAAQDLKAKVLLPVHSAKFALANHSWHEPLDRISELSEKQQFPIITPMIGEVVDLDHTPTEKRYWWKNAK